jgi:DNA-binding protein YbaB
MPDLQQLLQLSQQMQGKLQQLEHELLATTHEAQAGGGMVRVSVDGRGAVRRSHHPGGRDADLLSDLVLSARSVRRAADACSRRSAVPGRRRVTGLPPVSALEAGRGTGSPPRYGGRPPAAAALIQAGGRLGWHGR